MSNFFFKTHSFDFQVDIFLDNFNNFPCQLIKYRKQWSWEFCYSLSLTRISYFLFPLSSVFIAKHTERLHRLSVRTWRVKSAEHSYANQVCNWHCLCNYQCNPPLSTTSRKERRGRGWGKFTLGRSPRKWARCQVYNQVKTVSSQGKSAAQIILYFMYHHYYEGAALDLISITSKI